MEMGGPVVELSCSSFQTPTERKRTKPSNLLLPLLLLLFIFWGRKQDGWGNRHSAAKSIRRQISLSFSFTYLITYTFFFQLQILRLT